MAAQIAFLAGNGFTIEDLSGSGLGFYGDDGFGASVPVGSYQGRTYITNGAGTTQGAEVDNVKFLNAGSGILGQTGTGIALTAIPNYQATLNLRFTYDSAIHVQNVYARIYDRTDPNANASGLTCKVAEIIHPGITQANTGSGDTTWYTPGGSTITVPLAPSPGPSGLYAGNGANGNWAATQHDWYLAISASPDTVGSHTMFGIYASLEYL